jgi:peptidyl-prolyl cis-trans isomerase D
MLSGMRSFAKSKWAGLLLLLIVVAVGLSTDLNPFRGVAGGALLSSGDREVNARDVNRALSQYVNRYRQETGEVITERQAAQQGVVNQILNDQAQRTLVLRFADKTGIRATTEAVADTIASAPRFKNALGQLDSQLVTAFAQEMGLGGIDQLEDVWREDLTLGYVDQAVAAGFVLPKLLVQPLTAYFGEGRVLSFARLGPNSIGEQPAPTEEQLAAFYQERLGAFEQPERRAFSFVSVSANDFLGKVELVDADVRAEYDRRLKEFSAPETRVIVQFTSTETSKVQAVIDLTKQGVSITDAIARTPGLETVELTVKPGELQEKQVADVAFGGQLGETYGPIMLEGKSVGVNIKLVTPGVAQPFEAVAEQVRASIQEREAKRLYDGREETFFDLIDAGSSLEDIAREMGAPIVSLAPVSQNGQLDSGAVPEELRPQAESLRALFEGSGLGRTHVAEFDGGRAVLRLDAIVPARTPELAEVHDEVEQMYRAVKMQEAADKVVADTVAAINAGETFDAAAAKAKLIAVHPPQAFMRANPNGLDQAILERAFSADAGSTLVVRTSQGEPWVVKVETIEPVDPALADQVAAQVSQQIDQSVRADLNQVFMQGVQKSAKLKTNTKAIEAYLKTFQDEPEQ